MTRKWPRTSEETRAVLGTRPPIFFPLSPRLPRHGSARRREERAGRGEKRRTLIKGWRGVTGELWVTPIGFHSDDIRDTLAPSYIAMDQKRILVVEDDSAIRRGIVDALQFAGYETLQAANGNDGLGQALRATFDLLLLDLILPGPSGFDILKATREGRPTLPIIILTARCE